MDGAMAGKEDGGWARWRQIERGREAGKEKEAGLGFVPLRREKQRKGGEREGARGEKDNLRLCESAAFTRSSLALHRESCVPIDNWTGAERRGKRLLTAGPNGSEEETNESVKGRNTHGAGGERREPTKGRMLLRYVIRSPSAKI